MVREKVCGWCVEEDEESFFFRFLFPKNEREER